MDIQAKLDAISSLIEKVSDIKELKKDAVLAAEFMKMYEDSCLPRAIKDFCLDAHLTVSGNTNGPLDNVSKKQLKEIFKKLKVKETVRRN